MICKQNKEKNEKIYPKNQIKKKEIRKGFDCAQLVYSQIEHKIKKTSLSEETRERASLYILVLTSELHWLCHLLIPMGLTEIYFENAHFHFI